MPGKYSHAVVFANYSSHGVIGPPIDPELNYFDPVRDLTPVPKQENISRPPSAPPFHSRVKSTPTKASSRQSPFVNQRVTDPQIPETQSIYDYPYSLHGVSNHNGRKVIVDSDEEPPDSGTSIKGFQPCLLKSSLRQPTSNFLFSSPFDSYARNPKLIPQPDSPDREAGLHDNANISKPIQNSRKSKAPKIEPRDDVKHFARQLYHQRHLENLPPNLAKSHAESLLSIQQFLDSSHHANNWNSADSRRSFARQSTSGNGRLTAPPTSLPGTPKTTVQKNRLDHSASRGAPSFIDSFDDDDDAVNQSSFTPAQTIAPVSMTSNKGALDQKANPLAKSLPNESIQQVQNDTLRRRRININFHHPNTRHKSTEGDGTDGMGTLPLQSQSPLHKTPSRDIKRPFLPHKSLFNTPDDQLSPLPQFQSPESMTRGTGASSLDADFSNVSDRDEDDFSSPMTNIYVHRRCYRTVDKDIPRNEPRPRISTSSSSSSCQGKKTAQIFSQPPSQEPQRQAGTRTPEPRKHTPIIQPARGPNRVKPVNPMPNFGMPSIIRGPEKSTIFNPQNTTRANQTLPSSQQRLLSKRPQRLQPSPLIDCTTRDPRRPRSQKSDKAAELLGTEPTLENWWLPNVQVTKKSEFGAEGLESVANEQNGLHAQRARLGIHNENQTESQSQRVSRTQVEAADRAMETDLDNCSISSSQKDEDMHNDYVDEDGDEDDLGEEAEAALPPPDISRYRASGSSSDADNGMQTIFQVLHAGPDAKISKHGQSRTSGGGIDRLEAMLREQEKKTKKKKDGAKGVLDRLMGRS
ncbi:uncharacterized protein Z518_05634 [Rhinocladiella mackenziei CBS 650.93]|uniref:Uncharacterized protein n=1 Tax=Rhinocladiella mackenziei CBS 650.93 TaxID=1442369 RepID=A0A0D2IG40_9EURO|nr:uncharacterized protein Z518_05634 [Rhinocladiella mackenziei CBS 650.93]KIX04764.1 hypothetical protein Z518_05634 [Rhinocladiella mackenziei CBS 650.93]